jgi:hypothetical protein
MFNLFSLHISVSSDDLPYPPDIDTFYVLRCGMLRTWVAEEVWWLPTV